MKKEKSNSLDKYVVLSICLPLSLDKKKEKEFQDLEISKRNYIILIILILVSNTL